MGATLNAKLLGRIVVECRLLCKTGLHIGGSQEVGEIGTVDNIVAKTPAGEPFVPGSSLKGKMRALLEFALGKVQPERTDGGWHAPAHQCRDPQCAVCALFGRSGPEAGGVGGGEEEQAAEGGYPLPTRIRVEDAFLTEDSKNKLQEWLGEEVYTEIKWENFLDRLTSQATPRQFERVPAGAEFDVRMVLDVYDDADKKLLSYLLWAMRLLEDSALGGSGSRGYGRVAFEDIKVTWRPVGYYSGDEEEQPLVDGAGSVDEARKQLPDEYKKANGPWK